MTTVYTAGLCHIRPVLDSHSPAQDPALQLSSWQIGSGSCLLFQYHPDTGQHLLTSILLLYVRVEDYPDNSGVMIVILLYLCCLSHTAISDHLMGTRSSSAVTTRCQEWVPSPLATSVISYTLSEVTPVAGRVKLFSTIYITGKH